jgi:hypothetical protein
MSSVDIISLAADNPGATYVRIVIAGSVYTSMGTPLTPHAGGEEVKRLDLVWICQ